MTRFRRAVICAVAAAIPFAVSAGTEGCSSAQTARLETAISAASGWLATAAAQVGDNPNYRRWFGPYDAGRAATVRDNLGTLQSHMLIGTITAVCSANGTNDCAQGTFANVAPSAPYRIYICEDFFTLPIFPVQPPLSLENGTQEGTIIHEMTHFDIVNGTDDVCYSRSSCESFAASNPSDAIRNADNYQYFTEDTAEASF